MTELLRKAFDQASQLPPQVQDEVAGWVLAELASEERWAATLHRSGTGLSRLAAEAIEEHRRAESRPLDPEGL